MTRLTAFRGDLAKLVIGRGVDGNSDYLKPSIRLYYHEGSPIVALTYRYPKGCVHHEPAVDVQTLLGKTFVAFVNSLNLWPLAVLTMLNDNSMRSKTLDILNIRGHS